MMLKQRPESNKGQTMQGGTRLEPLSSSGKSLTAVEPGAGKFGEDEAGRAMRQAGGGGQIIWGLIGICQDWGFYSDDPL